MIPQNWILLVDPFKNLIDVYRMILESEKYFIETANNFEEALLRFSKREYAVVITEYFQEIAESYSIIPWVKNNFPETYIIMVTYKNIDDQTYDNLFETGLDDLIFKPYSLERILVHIKKGIRQRNVLLKKKELEKQSVLDPVASQIQKYILGQTYFKKCLRQELKRAKRHHHPLSLLVIQVPPREKVGSHFDNFFAEVANILRGYTREEDIVGRENGNFGVLLPETDQPGSRVVLQRLSNLIQTYQAFHHDKNLEPVLQDLSFQSFTYPQDFSVPKSLKTVLEEIEKEITH